MQYSKIVDELFELHMRVLRGLLQGRSFAEMETDWAKEFDRFNYRKLTRMLNIMSFSKDGQLRGAYPISPRKTDIEIAVEGIGAGYAMCAVDALGVANFFGATTTITAADAATEETLSLTIDAENATVSQYEEMAVTLPKNIVSMEKGRKHLDAAVDICPKIGFIKEPASLSEDERQWLDIMPLELAYQHGKRIFDLGAMKRQTSSMLAAISEVASVGPMAESRVVDLVIAAMPKGWEKMMSGEQMRSTALNQLLGRDLLKYAAESADGPTLELSTGGQLVIDMLVNY